MPSAPEPLASVVRAELARRRLPQAAGAAHLGLSTQSFNHRLRGRTPFTFHEVVALAELLEVPLSALAGLSQPTAQAIPA